MARLGLFMAGWRAKLLLMVGLRWLSQVWILYGLGFQSSMSFLRMSEISLLPVFTAFNFIDGMGRSSSEHPLFETWGLLVNGAGEIVNKGRPAFDAANGGSVDARHGYAFGYVIGSVWVIIWTFWTSNITVITCSVICTILWGVSLVLPLPEALATDKVTTKGDMASMAVDLFFVRGGSVAENLIYVSIMRGLFLALLTSPLPVGLVTTPKILYSGALSVLHFVLSFLSLSVWAFLLVYVQSRAQIVRDLRGRGNWKGLPKAPPRGTKVSGWKPNTRYAMGDMVSVSRRGGAGERPLSSSDNKSGPTYWELISDSACSSVRPSDLRQSRHNFLHSLFSKDVGAIRHSEVCSILIFALGVINVVQVTSSFFFTRSFALLVSTAVDLAVLSVMRALILSNFDHAGSFEPVFRMIDNLKGS